MDIQEKSDDSDIYSLASEKKAESNFSSDEPKKNSSSEESSADFVYSINNPEANSETNQTAEIKTESENASQTISSTNLDTNSSEVSEDIYAIKKPLELSSDIPSSSLPSASESSLKSESASTPFSLKSVKNKNSDKKSRSTINDSGFKDDFENRPAPSLDDLYERRRKARAEQEAAGEDPDKFLIPERPKLPDNPFWFHLFRPLFSPKFLVRILVIVAMGLIPFYLAMQFYIHLQFGEIEPTKPLNVFFQAIWQDRVILFLFSFLWGVLSIPNSFYVFEATTNGDDLLDEGPEFSLVGGFGQFSWFGIIILLSGVPWYLVFSPFGIGDFCFLIGVIILFPIFFLSCMETDSLFALLSKNVYRSFKIVRRYWIKFYIFSVILFAFSLFAATILLLAVAKNADSFWFVFFSAVFATLLFSIIPMFYLRVLGRLAWVIQEMKPNEQEES